MAELKSVSLYTVPSLFISKGAGEALEPFQRVVGMQHATTQQEILWSVIDPMFDETVFNPNDAQESKIDLSTTSIGRLVSFYARYFIERPEVQSGQFRRLEEYNCHRFGYWMRGSIVAQNTQAPDAPDYVVAEGYEVVGALPRGEHGVIGSRDDYALSGAALHSVVGLGEEREDCLQVTGNFGLLGVDTYKNILDWYNPEPDINARLYTI